MTKNIVDLTPQELNSYLNRKYGFGLYDFGYILSQLADNSFYESQDDDIIEFNRHQTIPPLNQLYRDQKELSWIKKRTLALFDNYLDRQPGSNRDEDFKARFDLHYRFNFRNKKCKDFSFYDYMHSFLEGGRAGLLDLRTRQEFIFSCLLDHVETEIACAFRKPGRPVDSENILYYTWALHIKDKNRAGNIHWGTLVQVHKWFWNRLAKHQVYNWLRQSINEIKSINDQFFKEKVKWSRFYKYICSGSEFPEFPSMPIYFGRQKIFRFKSKKMLEREGMLPPEGCNHPGFNGKGQWGPAWEYEELSDIARKNINKIALKYPEKKILIFPDFQFLIS